MKYLENILNVFKSRYFSLHEWEILTVFSSNLRYLTEMKVMKLFYIFHKTWTLYDLWYILLKISPKEIYCALLEVKLKSNTSSVPMDAFQRVLIVLGLLESMSAVLEPVFIQMKNFQRKIVMRTSSSSSCES